MGAAWTADNEGAKAIKPADHHFRHVTLVLMASSPSGLWTAPFDNK